jgi:hypothetical protein
MTSKKRKAHPPGLLFKFSTMQEAEKFAAHCAYRTRIYVNAAGQPYVVIPVCRKPDDIKEKEPVAAE